MTTGSEHTARHALETLRVLAESPEGRGTRLGVWETVSERIPENSVEAQKTTRSARSRGFTNYTFASSQLVAAGLLQKVERGLWEITEAGRAAIADGDAEEFYREVVRRSREVKAQRAESRQDMLANTIVAPNERSSNIRTVSRSFVEGGLRDLDSVFVPGRAVWRAGVVAELIETFVGQPDIEGEDFGAKLTEQLKHTGDDAKLLMAEIVAWQVLPLRSPGELKKRARIQMILDLMEHPVVIPAAIDSALKSWSFNAGRGMASQIYRGLSMMIQGIARWISLEDAERDEALDNPWAWREFVAAIPGTPFPTQRNELLYLVHPDSFGEVIAPDQREAIRDAFIGELNEPPSDDLDQDFLAVTIALQLQEAGPGAVLRGPAGGAVAGILPVHRSIRSRSLGCASPGADPGPVDPYRRAEFPPAGASLSLQLHIDEPWLDRVLSLIERRRQVILFGPPGTGKTFLAQALAKHVTSATTGETNIVQFHPTYSYEDFFEGFRPSIGADGQQLGFALRRGPLRRLADSAAANPEANYFLVIDEINRGNLAKIFGELYYLLEYRDSEISLLYSDEPFTLPANIFFIGTMNTADRSIAMLDAAMRRRFAFVELHPDLPPVNTLLAEWMSQQPFDDDRVALLGALNAKIRDHDAKVGPSFLMRDLHDEGVASVWEYEILPLLAEHHYADGTDVAKEYGVDTLRRAIGREQDVIEAEPHGDT